MKKNSIIQNSKGLRLSAIIEAPDFDKYYPFVILLHGFKGYKDEKHYSTLAEDLCKRSIGSIRFDTSGFGDSEGEIAVDFRFSNYVQDINDVFEYLIPLNYVNEKCIGVCGQSMGGILASIAVYNNPSIKAICAISPHRKISSVQEFKAILEKWKQDGSITLPSTKFGKITIPFDYINDMEKWDLAEILKAITVHQLYILGLNDKSVLPEETRRIYNMANRPKGLVGLEGMNHFYKNDDAMLKKVNEIVVDFFENIF